MLMFEQSMQTRVQLSAIINGVRTAVKFFVVKSFSVFLVDAAKHVFNFCTARWFASFSSLPFKPGKMSPTLISERSTSKAHELKGQSLCKCSPYHGNAVRQRTVDHRSQELISCEIGIARSRTKRVSQFFVAWTVLDELRYSPRNCCKGQGAVMSSITTCLTRLHAYMEGDLQTFPIEQ